MSDLITKPRRLLTALAAVAATVPLVVACAPSGPAEPRSVGTTLEEITELAQEEGTVHLIAYPEDWANYGESFEAFTAKYGVDVEVSSPDASSAEELEAVRTFAGTDRLPDVLDIGSTFTQEAIDGELIQQYEASTWSEIPDDLKDPDGYWSAAYYGVLSIGVNANEVDVPTSFADLFDEQYRGRIAFEGDPREGAAQLATVWAASLANGGSLDDIEPGIAYFERLANEGYLVQTADSTAALTTGEADVAFNWNYNFFGAAPALEQSGVDLEVTAPVDGVFGNYYAQPITNGAINPNAARLWVEWLLSDEGAAIYAKAGAIPARYEAITDAGVTLEGLPEPEIVEQVSFPDNDQRAAAVEVVSEQWAQRVATS